MKKTFLLLSMMLTFIFVSCGSNSKDEIKEVTAKGLSQGISKVVIENKIIECRDNKVLEQYIEARTCEALKADCSSHEVQGMALINVKRFACKSAVKIVTPVIMPSRYLPGQLKDAGCKSDYLDDLAKTLSNKLCDNL